MVKIMRLFIGSLFMATLLMGCKLATSPIVQRQSTVAYQERPQWLNQLAQHGVRIKPHRTHLELKLPVEDHFTRQADIKQHLVATLKPIAQQLQNNHYQLAEVSHYVTQPHLNKNEKEAVNQRVGQIVSAFEQLQVETKVVVKGRTKLRHQSPQKTLQSGPYIAINLYQTHQGHGLTY